MLRQPHPALQSLPMAKLDRLVAAEAHVDAMGGPQVTAP